MLIQTLSFVRSRVSLNSPSQREVLAAKGLGVLSTGELPQRGRPALATSRWRGCCRNKGVGLQQMGAPRVGPIMEAASAVQERHPKPKRSGDRSSSLQIQLLGSGDLFSAVGETMIAGWGNENRRMGHREHRHFSGL